MLTFKHNYQILLSPIFVELVESAISFLRASSCSRDFEIHSQLLDFNTNHQKSGAIMEVIWDFCVNLFHRCFPRIKNQNDNFHNPIIRLTNETFLGSRFAET